MENIKNFNILMMRKQNKQQKDKKVYTDIVQ